MRQRIQQKLRVLSYNKDSLVAATPARYRCPEQCMSLRCLYRFFSNSFQHILICDRVRAEKYQYDPPYKARTFPKKNQWVAPLLTYNVESKFYVHSISLVALRYPQNPHCSSHEIRQRFPTAIAWVGPRSDYSCISGTVIECVRPHQRAFDAFSPLFA